MEIDLRTVMGDDGRLPEYPEFLPGVRRAPRRTAALTAAQKRLALSNALRYIPREWHEQIAPEFARELEERGRIYGYRFMPKGRIYGRPVDEYPGRCLEGRAFRVMIDNNLDHEVALYPYELVTYGETGQVCQNWMQYRLICRYLELLTEDQTLVMMSGHPAGLFASHRNSPRVIITNGLMVGMFDDGDNWARAAAMADGLLWAAAGWLVTYEPALVQVVTPEALLAVSGAVLAGGVLVTTSCAWMAVNRYLRMKAGALYRI